MKFSDEHRANISKAQTGKKRGPTGPYKTPTVRKGKPFSAEHRKNLIGCRRIGRYPKTLLRYKATRFRSKWELSVAKIFSKRGIRWRYESKRFHLGDRTYTPDFYLPEQDCYWEIKGWFDPKFKQTLKLLREQYPEVSVVVATGAVIRLLDQGVTL
jgi:hypothetical protein